MFMLIFHLKPPIDLKSLLIREAANQRTTMEKGIGYKEEGSLIPRGREMIGSKALNCETMRHQHRIRHFEYSYILVINGLQILMQSKYNLIGKYVLMKTHVYVRSVGTLCNGHDVILTRGKEANPTLSSNSQIDWVTTFYLLKPPESRLLQRSGTHIIFLTQLSPSFGRKSGNNTRGESPRSNGY